MYNPNVSSNMRIFTASKCDDYQFLLNESLIQHDLEDFLIAKLNNKTPLATVYNEFLDTAQKENYDYIILTHDDVIFEHDPRLKLEDLFHQFDVVGVAGCSNATIKSPALWHLMGEGHLHGAVAHKYGDKKFMTSFGVYPHRVVMIDGVFMALNRKAIETVRFDDNCPSAWHFYDLLATLSAHKQGLKVGVGDILITHESPGLQEFTEDWKAGERYFLNKFGQD
jgi:hypothetical protein